MVAFKVLVTDDLGGFEGFELELFHHETLGTVAIAVGCKASSDIVECVVDIENDGSDLGVVAIVVRHDGSVVL